MKLLSLGLALLLALAMACGGDDDDSSGAAQPSGGNGGAAPTEVPSGSGGSAPSGGGGGSLTLGDEVVELSGVLCLLQPQDVAGSPGKILLTGIGRGQFASGEGVAIDVTRYDEESLFTGDEVEVLVGADPTRPDYSWDASADLGTIEQDGSTIRAEGLTFINSEDATELTGGFELRC